MPPSAERPITLASTPRHDHHLQSLATPFRRSGDRTLQLLNVRASEVITTVLRRRDTGCSRSLSERVPMTNATKLATVARRKHQRTKTGVAIGLHTRTVCPSRGSQTVELGRGNPPMSCITEYSAFASSASQLSGDSGPADGFLFGSGKLAVLTEQRIMEARARALGRTREELRCLTPPGAGGRCELQKLRWPQSRP